MSAYEGREQSLVKHQILRSYLGRFAHIIGTWKRAITYVDCFSGPWSVQTPDLSDSSFAIALSELRKARQTLREQRSRELSLRCFFLEENPSAYRKLQAFATHVTDAEVQTKNARLEQAIPQILEFVDRGGHDSFPFFLIDPNGWSGFELDVIAPLLRRNPGEVLVNFMTSFIRRFIRSTDPEIQRGFDRTFGPFRPSPEELEDLTEEDLDDALVRSYSTLLKTVGGYDYVCNAIVLHPEFDATHFHLIYGTRHPKGIEVFKDAERRAVEHHEDTRAQLRTSKLEKKEGPLLFGPQAMGNPQHFNRLRERYTAVAKRSVIDLLNSKDQVRYDDAYVTALVHPLVWESDLKTWISSWQRSGVVEILGLRGRQKVPKRESGNLLKAAKRIP